MPPTEGLPMVGLMVAVFVAFWGTVFYFVARFVRAFEGRGAVRRTELEQLRERVARLEDEMGSASSEIERLSEGQRFTTNLLAGRSTASPPPSGGPSTP